MSRAASRLRICITCVAFGLAFAGGDQAGALGRHPQDVVNKQLMEYRSVLLAYFKPFNLLPIILPAGQQPGDVFNITEMGVLRSAAHECFPGLVEPAPVQSALAYTFSLDTTKAGLALGLPSLGSLNVGGDFEQTIKVSYSEVKVAAVSQQALKDAVSSSKCPDVASVVNKDQVQIDPASKVKLLAVVGTLVTAKREIFIGAKSNFDLKASVDQLAALLSATGLGAGLKIIGVDPSLSAALGFGGKSGLLVQSDYELPVAFMPAFIPEVIFANTQGVDKQTPKAVQWQTFEATDPKTTKILDSFVDAAIQK